MELFVLECSFYRVPGRPADGNLTAASLIDAIITHQINQTASEPPVIRDGHRPSFVSIRCVFSQHNRFFAGVGID